MELVYAYLLILSFAAIAALYRWRLLSDADRWMAILISLALLQECVAAYMRHYLKNNFASYHIYTPIEVGILCMYFDRSLRFSKPYQIGGIMAVISAAISIWSTVIQSMAAMNTYFLLYEGCLIIIFCLLSFYKLLIRDDIVPGRMAHFWLTISFLFYHCLTYANLGLFERVPPDQRTIRAIFGWALYFTNASLYTALATIFVRYKKLIPSGD